MIEHRLAVTGVGLVTDAYQSACELGESVKVAGPLLEDLRRAKLLDAAAVAEHDVLPQVALRAAHQAWSMGEMAHVSGDRVALVFVSGWGMIDSTVAYLESMLDAEGRYASPRHFSRSVYCSAASVLAIHFQIHGPCVTLAFDERAGPVQGALAHGWRLLAADRADRVLVLWAEQAAAIALELARRAAQELNRGNCVRYLDGLGYGATALLLGRHGEGRNIGTVNADQPAGAPAFAVPGRHGAASIPRTIAGKPFAMDGAVALLASILVNG